jgi:glyoxylase-like metal-dependent hydrolase (beta-lactamase superfamily II)
MCLTNTHQSASPPAGPPYHCSRLNDTTYLIIHHDKYSEFPFIYVKLYQKLSLAVVIDTGCGAHNGQVDSPVLELKDFVHHEVLSSEQASFDFLVVCTHCHFDHIGGIEAFSDAGARIVASGYDRDFLRPERRNANSLCGAFGMRTPKYEISRYAQDGEELEHKGHGLGLQIIHTPGHTPDSIAIYDEAERWLFVGDTCYQRFATMPWGEEQAVPIILPLQGNWTDFIASMYTLRGSDLRLATRHLKALRKTFCTEPLPSAKVSCLAQYQNFCDYPGTLWLLGAHLVARCLFCGKARAGQTSASWHRSDSKRISEKAADN